MMALPQVEMLGICVYGPFCFSSNVSFSMVVEDILLQMSLPGIYCVSLGKKEIKKKEK